MLRISMQFFAHKKGVGSTKNGRDSEAKRLGVKRGDGPGNNVGIGSDDTLFATIDGQVRFERYGRDRKRVSVYAVEQ